MSQKDAYKELGNALDQGDQGSAVKALMDLLQQLGITPPESKQESPLQQQQTQEPEQGTNQPESNAPPPEDLNNFGETKPITKEEKQRLEHEEDAKFRSAASREWDAKRNPKNDDGYGKELDDWLERKARRISASLISRLSFLKADTSRRKIGHKSGRITSKSAVPVATNDDAPFAKRTVPRKPSRVLVVIAHDVSGSMGVSKSSDNMGQALTLVTALQTLEDDYPNIKVLVVPWATDARCGEKIRAGEIIKMPHYHTGTNMSSAFTALQKNETYKQSVANKDAIVGVMITDGHNTSRDKFSCNKFIKSIGRTQSWCCAVIGHKDRNKPNEYMTLNQEEVFGLANTFGFSNVNESVPIIAKTIQKTIARAEARR